MHTSAAQLSDYLSKKRPSSSLNQWTERVDTQWKALLLYKNWWLIYLDYFKLLKKPITRLRLRNGTQYDIRSGSTDRGVVNEIWIRRDYSPDGFAIRPTDTVVDIGAQIGSFTVMAGTIAKAGRVISFEPTSLNFPFLKKNVELNRLSNVHVYKKAVASQNGTAEMTLSDTNSGGHSLLTEFTPSGQKETVETISLPSIFSQEKVRVINFLKLDCEGAEYDILYNCPDDTLNHIEKMAMEYHQIDENTRNGAALKGFLEQKGWTVWIHRSLIYALNPAF